eukprot:3702605-Amphidinium_carterae.2
MRAAFADPADFYVRLQGTSVGPNLNNQNEPLWADEFKCQGSGSCNRTQQLHIDTSCCVPRDIHYQRANFCPPCRCAWLSSYFQDVLPSAVCNPIGTEN